MGEPTWTGTNEVFWPIVHEKHVDFGFFRGAELDVPKGLLEGTGKRFRRVKMRDADDIRPADLRRAIRPRSPGTGRDPKHRHRNDRPLRTADHVARRWSS